MQLAVFIK